jgi:hypothetical protein
MKAETREELKALIQQLELQIANLEARLPAHSIPVSMVTALDDLEDQLTEARSRLSRFQKRKG